MRDPATPPGELRLAGGDTRPNAHATALPATPTAALAPPAIPALAGARVPGAPHAGPEVLPPGVPVAPIALEDVDPLTALVAEAARQLFSTQTPTSSAAPSPAIAPSSVATSAPTLPSSPTMSTPQASLPSPAATGAATTDPSSAGQHLSMTSPVHHPAVMTSPVQHLAVMDSPVHHLAVMPASQNSHVHHLAVMNSPSVGEHQKQSSPFHGAPHLDGLLAGTPGEVIRLDLVDAERAPAPSALGATRDTLTLPSAHDAGVPALSSSSSSSSGDLDPLGVRAQFPILRQRINGHPLVWLDNAATTQKPQAVIDRISRFYETENSNIHRAAHTLAGRATDAYEGARESVRRFIGAPSKDGVVFVRGATEGINLVAKSFGAERVGAGDEILITHLEHHANIVPWQQLAQASGATLRVAPVDDSGQIMLDAFAALLSPRTRIVALPVVSNALGTITPTAAMTQLAKAAGAFVVVDGAQSVSHLPTDVSALGADFFVFSGHKVFAPTGIGVVWGRPELWNQTGPWQGGGNMIVDVTFERTVFHPAPMRFEAGTGNIADAVGLGTALEWLMSLGVARVAAYEHALLEYGTERLREVPGLRMIGTAPEKAGVMSFVVDGHDTQAMSKALDDYGIATRGGHHCAQPILRRMGVETTVRASLAPYNTTDDLDALVEALCAIVARGAR